MNMKPAETDLQQLPGVGPNTTEHFCTIGIRRIADLRGKDPEKLFERICQQYGKPMDRCLLYVFRCAVYAASTRRPKPDLLKWWNWKDSDAKRRRRS